MQAQSLAWDLDLRYSRRDYDRFVAQWGMTPEGLILQSGDGGRRWSTPSRASYALWIAPFLRLSPTRGAVIANALLLAAGGRRSPRALSRGASAPRRRSGWRVWIFALGRLRLRLLGALRSLPDVPRGDRPGARLRRAARRRAPPELAGAGALRWLAAGGSCSAWSSPSRPFYGTLLVPACSPRRCRRRGAALGVAALVGRRGRRRRSAPASPIWPRRTPGPPMAASARASTPRRLPRGRSAAAGELAAAGRRARQPLAGCRRTMVGAPRLTAWNVALLPGGAATSASSPTSCRCCSASLAFRRGEGRWALLARRARGRGLLPARSAVQLLRRRRRDRQPLLPAGLPGVLVRRRRGRPAPAWAVLRGRRRGARGARSCWPCGRQPRAFFLDDGRRLPLRHARRPAACSPTRRPSRTSSPPASEDFIHNGLWIKPLTTSVRPEADGAPPPARRRRPRRAPGGQLPAAPRRADDRRSPGAAEDRHRRRRGEREPPPAARRLRPPAPLPGPRAVHRMWWSENENPVYLYQLRLDAPAGFAFQLQPLARTP